MKLDLTDMIYALSFTLDHAETALLGVDTGHGKRVAYLTLLMAKEAGLSGEELRDLAGCCILHDNALTEFIHEELVYSLMMRELSAQHSDHLSAEEVPLKKPDMHHFHCIVGEQNIRLMPFHTDVEDVILCHHENADGSGPMGRAAAQTPFKAQLLHLADEIDVSTRLPRMTEAEFEEVRQRIQAGKGTLFSEEAVDLFMKAVDYDKIVYLQEKGMLSYLHEQLLPAYRDYTDQEIHNIAGLFAKIVDYKSVYTQAHSQGVAEKAEIMAHYYGFDAEKTIRYYFAAAMHDIGKMVIPNAILEKPGRLTENEFTEMKGHADATYRALSQIKEIPDIIRWASNHHEKLNGTGYPHGATAESLSFEECLMTCIDIYQALTEKRPYRDRMTHEQAISIMLDMADNGELNEKIVRDMDRVMAPEAL